MKRLNTRVLVEAAVMIALASVLSLIKVWEAPYGGSVTAASMVPIMFIALRHGTGVGLLSGAVHGVIQLIMKPYIYHPFQVFLDYPLAFGLLGLAGLARRQPLVAVTTAVAGRFMAHWLSGVIFFSSYAPEGMSGSVYSAVYNLQYLGPELIISLVVLIPVQRVLSRAQH
ncbi:MAG: energy-coupled thiamine transporter ThiT [Bacillota bacterium]